MPDGLIAWHAREYNLNHLGVEVVQARIDIPYTDAQYEAAAWWILGKQSKYGFPLDREHIVGHEEIPPGVRDGKSDPGYMWDWTRFMALLTGH